MNEQNGKVIVIKNWQAVLTLLAWLVLTVAQFVTLRAETQQNVRDIQEIKANHVTKDRFEEYQQDIQRRLQRIEDKLDRDRALRNLN